MATHVAKINVWVLYELYIHKGFPGVSISKEPTSNAGDPSFILGHEYPLKEEMTIHSSILFWEIPRTEKPGGLQSMEVAKSQTWLSDYSTSTAISYTNSLICLYSAHLQKAVCMASLLSPLGPYRNQLYTVSQIFLEEYKSDRLCGSSSQWLTLTLRIK